LNIPLKSSGDGGTCQIEVAPHPFPLTEAEKSSFVFVFTRIMQMVEFEMQYNNELMSKFRFLTGSFVVFEDITTHPIPRATADQSRIKECHDVL
jgi:hypothetical protein